jgi:hypothetical protein
MGFFKKDNWTPEQVEAHEAAVAGLKAVGTDNKALRAEYRERMQAATTREEKAAVRAWMKQANNDLNRR